MPEPKRIQRKRTRGWRMPDGAIYVGRPSKWGNPFRVGGFYYDQIGGKPGLWVITSRQKTIAMYRERCDWRTGTDDGAPSVYAELRGKDLVCWCPLVDADGNRVPCHADVLLEWANEGESHAFAEIDALNSTEANDG